ncbi:MAG: hypothetical protein IPM84_22715 [Anaerolineae bacterium]|nr:hypothetical protein [Anaerolineae bacterium]
MSLNAQVKTLAGVADSTPANNFASAQVSYETAPGLSIVIFRIGYTFQGTTYYPAQNHVTQLMSWLRRAYPTPKIEFVARDLYWGTMTRQWVVNPNTGQGSWQSTSPTCNGVNFKLKLLWDFDYLTGKISSSTRYYGMVDDTIAFMRGCAPIPGKVASGPTGSGAGGWDTDGSYGDWYGGHELAHSFGRRHANFCGAVGGPSYPYPGGRISPVLTGPTALYGFDAGPQTVYGPTWTDVMTYCANEWISDFTFEALLDRFQSRRGLLTAATATDRLLVSGSIDPATAAVALESLYVIPNAAEITPPIPGPYAIVLRDTDDGELARYPFTPTEMEGGPLLQSSDPREVELLSISELVPYVAGTVRVDIEGPDGDVLSTVTAGANSPTVTVLSPNRGETPGDGPVTVTWSASDADGDPLTFAVQFTPDDGVTWQMVTQSITGTSAQIPRANLSAGTAARFRVWVSDGIHSASDMSDGTFVVPNLAPTVAIVQPEGAVVIMAGQTLTLVADAYDADTGNLDDDQVRWESSLGGPLGSGAQLTVVGLSVGSHTITVTATDEQGASASAAVQVTVLPEDELTPLQVFLPVVQH